MYVIKISLGRQVIEIQLGVNSYSNALYSNKNESISSDRKGVLSFFSTNFTNEYFCMLIIYEYYHL